MPKFSIIIPVYNAIKYLPTCIKTIVSQQYTNYELIISDNKSTDGTTEYLKNLKNPLIKIYTPPNFLSLEQNWNYAITKATGDWLICVGADDGLLPYFFDLAKSLIKIAENKNINIIKSNRVYYFWDGAQDIYGDIAISYSASSNIKIKSTKKLLFKELYKETSYVNMPQMYTSSMFHKTVIKKAIQNSIDQNILHYYPQDADLGIIGCIYENRYLYTEMPLGWVGSSPASTGVNEKKNLVLNTDDEYKAFSGKTYRTIHSCTILLAGSLLKLENSIKNKNIIKKKFRITRIQNKLKILCNAYKSMMTSNDKNSRMKYLEECIKAVGFSVKKIQFMVKLMDIKQKLKKFFCFIPRQIHYFMFRCRRKLKYLLKLEGISSHIHKTYNDNYIETMEEINQIILKLPETKQLLDELAKKN